MFVGKFREKITNYYVVLLVENVEYAIHGLNVKEG